MEKYTGKVRFVKTLPEVNFSEDILILESAIGELKADWIDFIDDMICSDYLGIDFKRIYDELYNYKYGDKKLYDIPNNVKPLVGIDAGLNVLKSSNSYDVFKLELNIDYQSLMYKLNSDGGVQVKYKYIRYSTILQNFIVFQLINKKILCPFKKDIFYGYKVQIIEKCIMKHSLYAGIIKYIESINGNKKTKQEYLKSIKKIYTHTSWHSKFSITEDALTAYQMTYFKDKDSKYHSIKIVLNHIRRYLIENGRVDINSPQTFINGVRSSQQKNSYDMVNPFGWLETVPNEKLHNIKKDANEYLSKLQEDGLQLSTIKKYMVSINTLLRFLIAMDTEYEELNENSIKILYEPNGKYNIYTYLLNLNISKRSAIENIGFISKFLEFCGLMTQYTRKYIPRFRLDKRKITHRNAMPLDMLNHLIEIIKTRPPKPNTAWLPKKADISWWAFKDVYPVQPLMMLMHLKIPIRGGQLRHLCRKMSLVINEKEGTVERFIINTDKNVNRTELQEIPNVWSDLNIFADYLKWHKEYFKDITPYKYNNDDNSPWEDIEPLFLIPSNPIPITLFQHKAYFNKLLCTYQLEMDEKYKNKEISYRVDVASMKDGSEFFTNLQELDSATDSKLESKVKVAYDIHSIRVTGITRYLESGLNLTILQSLTGHVDSNMIVSVYTKFTYQEKKDLLRTAVEKISFGSDENLLKSAEEFVFAEIPKHYNTSNPKEIRKVFRENGLFSLPRKASSLFEDTYDIDLGVDIAIDIHPSLWKPMIHGICPSVSCLEGRDRKCSICPYFITGRLFINGIKHMANLSMLSFHRLTKEFEEDKKASIRYGNSKSSVMELLMEEILGWHQIINEIENNAKEDTVPTTLPKVFSENRIGVETVPVELAYLNTCYQAKLMGVEQDQYGLKVLTIRAIKIANMMNNNDEINKIIADEDRAVDYLMLEYNKSVAENLLSNFIKKLEN